MREQPLVVIELPAGQGIGHGTIASRALWIFHSRRERGRIERIEVLAIDLLHHAGEGVDRVEPRDGVANADAGDEPGNAVGCAVIDESRALAETQARRALARRIA